jgi:hypothetical protein
MADPPKPESRIGRDDLTVFVGLACLAAGAWSVIGLAALILPGSVLVWYALPPRPPFIRQDR